MYHHSDVDMAHHFKLGKASFRSFTKWTLSHMNLRVLKMWKTW